MVDVEKALSIVDNFYIYRDIPSILIKGNINRKPKVSICVPTYNRVETLKQTIESCLHQENFDDYVIIICDNNPLRNDETEKYISQLNSDKIIYYKNSQNLGMYGNLNRLYELSLSEFTVCIHDDDMLYPHFLDLCYNIISKDKSIDILYPKKRPWLESEVSYPTENLNINTEVYKMDLIDFSDGNPCPPTGMISRTNSILSIGGYEYNTWPSNDYYFNVKAIHQNLNIYFYSQELYIYRWACNASLKNTTILGFMSVDPPLKRWLVKEMGYTNFIFKLYMNSYSLFWVTFFRKYYPNDPIENVDTSVKLQFTYFDRVVDRLFMKFVHWKKHKSHLSNKLLFY